MLKEDEDIYDAVIVGLGPVGSLCANLLCSYGLRVLVVEQTQHSKFTRPRAIALEDESMRVLQRLGLLEAFLADTCAVTGVQFMTREGRYLNGTLPPEGQGRPGAWTGGNLQVPDSPQGSPFSVFFYQPRLEELLRRNLQCRVAYGTKFVGLEETAESVTVRLRKSRADWKQLPGGEVIVVEGDGEVAEPWTVRARYVLGCDGSRSDVGRAFSAGVAQLKDLQFDEDWCVVDVMLLDDTAVGRELPYMVVQICEKARKVTYMTASWVTDRPRRGRHIRWEFEVLPSDDRALVATHGWLQQHFLSQWLAPSQYEIIRAAVYRFHSVLSENWQSPVHGRSFVLGDAAHQTPPFNGQGLNGGFRDCNNLCWKLAMALRKPMLHGPLLRTYQQERYPHMSKAILQTIETGRLINYFCNATDLDEAVRLNQNRGYGRAREARQVTAGLFSHRGVEGAEEFVGLPCPQPLLRGKKLDVLLGTGFALLLRNDNVQGTSAPLPAAELAELGVNVVSLDLSELGEAGTLANELFRAMLDRFRAVLVRPDKLVFGVVPADAGGGAEAQLLLELQQQLGLRAAMAKL